MLRLVFACLYVLLHTSSFRSSATASVEVVDESTRLEVEHLTTPDPNLETVDLQIAAPKSTAAVNRDEVLPTYAVEDRDRIEIGLFATNEHRKNHRLTKVPITKVVYGLAGLAPYHCLAYCLQEGDACAAFNLRRSDGTCELLSIHLCNHSGLKLDYSPGFDYFDVYEVPGVEANGPMHNTMYCMKRGFCNPECEPWAYMPLLDEPCSEDFECQIRAGRNAVCRTPPGLCKCENGYFIEQAEDGSKSCVKMDAEGFRVFPNLKSETKQGLYFKLVFINKNFEQASNHCIEAEGGYLATAEDGDTNRFLREYMRKNKVRSAYLGLSDQAQEGNWIWIHSGQKLKTSQFWKSGAPDNFNDIEHCATITNEIDFGWDDVPCDKATKFFCQRPETN